MVEDNEIKAQVSPFAIREGEIKTFDGKDGYVSMNQIVHKINIGHINEIHFAILDLVNEFEFITSRQIYQMLEIKGIDPKSQDKLNNKLDALVKSKILTRYYFTSDEGKGIYRIYCLEKMGKYLLTSKEVECKWQPSDNTKPVPMIKKRLAGNQVLIAYLRKVKAFDSYVVKPAITAKTLGKVFKATGGSVKLTKNNKSIQFLFEAVRREFDWKKKLVEKMNLYKDFYENFYYEQVGSTDEERADFLSKYESIGIKINLDNLSRYGENKNADEISKFVNQKTKKACDKTNTKVVIYPQKPYNKTSYKIETQLDCGFDETNTK